MRSRIGWGGFQCGFSAKPTGPPHLFCAASSKGLQNFDQRPKKSFSTESAMSGNSASKQRTAGLDEMRTFSAPFHAAHFSAMALSG
jgi:hypothetical protein